MAGRSGFILLAVLIARFGFGYQIQTVASIGPELRALFGLNYAGLGTLIGLYMVSGIFVAVPLGLLARRFGEKPVLATGLAIMTLGATLSGLSDGPTGIGAGRAIAGIGAVSMVVIQGKILADWFPGRKFLMAISASVCAWPVGVGLGQLVQAPLSRAYGWHWAFLSGALISALSLILFLLAHRPAQHAVAVPRAFSLPSRSECALVIVGGCIWGSFNAAYIGFVAYVPSLLAERGASTTLTALVITLATWGNVPATLLGGTLAARYGGWPIFLTGMLAAAGGTAAIGLFDAPMLWAFLFGVVGSLHPGVIVARGTLSARPENRVVGLGMFYSTYYASGTVLPALCGKIGDLTNGPTGALLAAAAISLLAIPLYLVHRAMGHRSGIMPPGV
jgi:MFS family permease